MYVEKTFTKKGTAKNGNLYYIVDGIAIFPRVLEDGREYVLSEKGTDGIILLEEQFEKDKARFDTKMGRSSGNQGGKWSGKKNYNKNQNPGQTYKQPAYQISPQPIYQSTYQSAYELGNQSETQPVVQSQNTRNNEEYFKNLIEKFNDQYKILFEHNERLKILIPILESLPKTISGLEGMATSLSIIEDLLSSNFFKENAKEDGGNKKN